jgi:hypothetical protein
MHVRPVRWNRDEPAGSGILGTTIMTQNLLFDPPTETAKAPVTKNEVRQALVHFLDHEGAEIVSTINMALERYGDCLYLTDIWQSWSNNEAIRRATGISGQFFGMSVSAGRNGGEVDCKKTAFMDRNGALVWTELLDEILLPPTPVFGLIRDGEVRSVAGNDLCVMILEILNEPANQNSYSAESEPEVTE